MINNIQETKANASDILQTKVAFINAIFSPTMHQTVSVQEALTKMTSSEFEGVYREVDTARTFGGDADYKRAKEKLPAVVFAGSVRPGSIVSGKNMDTLNGVMVLDFDHLTNAAASLEMFKLHPNVLFAFVSPSGAGLKVGVYCDYLKHSAVCSPTEYTHYYRAVLEQAAMLWPALTADKSSCNVNRLCFGSPYTIYTASGDIQPFHVEKYVKPKRPEVRTAQYTEARMKELLGALDASMCRADWYKVLGAVHSDSESWLDLINEWSSWGSNYKGFDEIDSIWGAFDTEKDNIAQMASVEYMARKAGYVPSTDWSVVMAQLIKEPEGVETPPPGTSFEDLIDGVVPGNVDLIQQCVQSIALVVDGIQSADMVMRLKHKSDLSKQEIKDAIKDIKRQAKAVGDQDTPNATPGQKWLLDNMVTIRTGTGGYFNLSNLTRISSHRVLDAAFSHLQGGEEDPAPANWLAPHDAKQVADGICWSPTTEQFVSVEGMTMVNSYRGPTVAPVQNDQLLSGWLKVCNLIFGEHCDLVLDHMAFSIQHPTVKIRWQVLIHGPARSGKTMAFEPLLELFESSAGMVSKDEAKAAWGDIWLGNKFILFEEVCSRENSGQFDNLKTKLANSDVERLNIKGSGIVHQRNVYSMYMLSNNADALRFDEDQDKLLVLESPAPSWPPEVYNAIGKSMKGTAFLGAFYFFMLHRDVSNFKHSALPVRTEATIAMSKWNIEDRELDIAEAIDGGMVPFHRDVVTYSEINDWLKGRGMQTMGNRRLSPLLLSKGWIICKGRKREEEKWLPGVSFYAKELACQNMGPTALFDLYTSSRFQE